MTPCRKGGRCFYLYTPHRRVGKNVLPNRIRCSKCLEYSPVIDWNAVYDL